MPRGSNRVGVEVEPLPLQPTANSSADLLKAKKAERRARARRRAEEKKLREASQQQVASPELDLSSKVKNPAERHEELELEEEGADDDGGPTGSKRKKTLPTPEADEPGLHQLQHHEQQQQSLTDVDQPDSNYGSSLVQARAEFGTEEVLDVDAYVAALNSQEPQALLALKQQPTELPVQVFESPPSQHDAKLKHKKEVSKKRSVHHIDKQPKDSPDPQDVAATRIQKALKRKLIKKCTTFLRHSSKVFADLSTPSAELPSLPCDGDPNELLARSTDNDADIESQQHGDEASEQADTAAVRLSKREHKDSRPASRRESASRAATLTASRRTSDESDGEISKRHRRGRQQRHQDSSSALSESSLDENSPREGSNNSSDSSGEQDACSRSASSQSPRGSRFSSNSVSLAAVSMAAPSPLASSSKQDGRHIASATETTKTRTSVSTDEVTRSREEDNAAGTNRDGPTSDLLFTAAAVVQSEASKETTTGSTAEATIDAATKIQAWLRGIDGRHRAHARRVEFDMEMESEALLEVHAEASVRIQAIVRGFLTRQRLDVSGVQPPNTRAERNTKKVKKKKKNRRASITAFFKGEGGTPANGSVAPDVEVVDNKEKVPRRSGSQDDDDTQEEVAEWPQEFNIEGLDEWDELNSVANVRGDLVTYSHFLGKSKLRVFCGTWNMHAKKPQDDLRLWVPLNKYHIVAVGTEECVNSIAKSVVFTSKKQWESLLKDTLGDEYVLVASHSLTAIHNIVFVHESVIPLLSNIQSDAVATGLGNQLGNKGGVGIAFSIGRTSFAFVNCHFDAHQHNTEKRNGNFHRINQELKLYPLQASSVTSTTLTPTSAAVTGESSLDGLGRTTTTRFSLSSPVLQQAGGGLTGKKLAISESFDRVFWFGDLNYRINGTRRVVDLLLLRNQHDVLRFNDQLQIEMSKGNVFQHFQEGPLHFHPTYKFDKRSNVYDSSAKQRIPSWTDRILYLSNDKPSDIEILSYRSQMSFQTSDHRPVGAAFQVAFKHSTNRTTEGGGGGVGGGDHDFNRVLARGYKPSQAKSEVCAVQ